MVKRRWLRIVLSIVLLVALATTWMMSADTRRAALNAAFANAVGKGDIREVKRLFAAGADPNVQQEYASFHESFAERLQRILHGRPAPEMRKGKTALMVAAAYGDLELVRKLLESGANPNETYREDGGSVLNTAATEGHTEVVRMLLDAGANVNYESFQIEKTPLMCAVARKGPAELVKLLLDRGANVDVKNDRGDTALDLARKRGDERIIKLLQVAVKQHNIARSRH